MVAENLANVKKHVRPPLRHMLIPNLHVRPPIQTPKFSRSKPYDKNFS